MTFGLILILLMNLAVCIVCAQDQPTPSVVNVSSLKDVETICLGYINGDPVNIGKFKLELKENLKEQGFQVTEDRSKCEATLIGALQVNIVQNDALTVLLATHKWVVYPAWAQMKLITESYKIIWQRDFNAKTSFELKLSKNRKKYVIGDGIKNRALEIGEALAIDKKMVKK